jgi:hypothetical protein
MTPINLIPASRRAAKRRRMHLRWCAAGCVAFVGAAASVSLAWRATATESDSGITEQLAAVAGEIDQNTRAVATADAQVEALRAQLASNRQVLSQPDWSLLLAILGHEAGEQIILHDCVLKSQDAPRGGSSPAAPGGELTLHLAGYGKTSEAVADFVLRLESTKLFSHIKLAGTAHDTFLGSDAYRFSVDCPLDGK